MLKKKQYPFDDSIPPEGLGWAENASDIRQLDAMALSFLRYSLSQFITVKSLSQPPPPNSRFVVSAAKASERGLS
ncbi:hypothetical protein ACLOJK_010884 [Asimina triloba]